MELSSVQEHAQDDKVPPSPFPPSVFTNRFIIQRLFLMEKTWSSLVDSSNTMMFERQRSTLAQFGVNNSMQYNWNFDRAEMIFSSQGEPIVRTDLQVVGSISALTRKGLWNWADKSISKFAGRRRGWLWGWANKSVPIVATWRLAEVRRYGEEQGFSELTEPEWPADKVNGQDLMIVSGAILGTSSFFYAHTGGLDLFLLLDNFRIIKQSNR